jgi:hypothetical protein
MLTLIDDNTSSASRLAVIVAHLYRRKTRGGINHEVGIFFVEGDMLAPEERIMRATGGSLD